MKRIVYVATEISARFLWCLFTISLLVTPGLAVTGAKADDLTFELRIERGQLPPAKRLIRVKQGDVVKLRWSSDRPIALHLHGYDLEQKVEPGVVAEMTFTARATGRFPVAEHQARPGGSHTHGAPIVQVEVLPR
jgi:Putative multicopper oxidases